MASEEHIDVISAPADPPVPDHPARIARAAFPEGNRYMRMRDTLESIVDAGTIDATLQVSSPREHQIDLVGPVCTDVSWQARAGQDDESGALGCPAVRRPAGEHKPLAVCDPTFTSGVTGSWKKSSPMVSVSTGET
jgi:hypothetical protein